MEDEDDYPDGDGDEGGFAGGPGRVGGPGPGGGPSGPCDAAA